MKDLSKSRKFWNTLTDFKNVIEASNTKEKVKYFDGHNLITNKFEYTMCDRQISRIELK
jgi:hypothetical protein